MQPSVPPLPLLPPGIYIDDDPAITTPRRRLTAARTTIQALHRRTSEMRRIQSELLSIEELKMEQLSTLLEVPLGAGRSQPTCCFIKITMNSFRVFFSCSFLHP